MSGLINYLSSWVYAPIDENNTDNLLKVPPAPPLIINSKSTLKPSLSVSTPKKERPKEEKTLITMEDLLKIKLKPISDSIPGPARNMPVMSKFQLNILTKGHLQAILSVKLRKITVSPRQKVFINRHPVLRELQQKVKKL